MRKIFGTHVQAQPFVGKICWGSCGKGIVGGLSLGPDGDLIPCYEEKCEHEEKSKSFGEVEIDGEKMELVVRKLKEG